MIDSAVRLCVFEQYEACISIYNRALEIDRNCARALSARAMCQLQLKRYDEALNDSLKALEIDPKTFYRCNIRVIEIHLLFGNYEKANEAVDQYFETYPLNKFSIKDTLYVLCKMEALDIEMQENYDKKNYHECIWILDLLMQVAKESSRYKDLKNDCLRELQESTMKQTIVKIEKSSSQENCAHDMLTEVHKQDQNFSSALVKSEKQEPPNFDVEDKVDDKQYLDRKGMQTKRRYTFKLPNDGEPESKFKRESNTLFEKIQNLTRTKQRSKIPRLIVKKYLKKPEQSKALPIKRFLKRNHHAACLSSDVFGDRALKEAKVMKRFVEPTKMEQEELVKQIPQVKTAAEIVKKQHSKIPTYYRSVKTLTIV